MYLTKHKSKLMSAGSTAAVSDNLWLYQFVSVCGSFMFYDTALLIKYRQYEGSLIGANINYRSQIERMLQALNNQFRTWNNINTLALNQSKHLLTQENQTILS